MVGAPQSQSLSQGSNLGYNGDYGMNNMNNGWHNAGAYNSQQMNLGYNINGNNNGGNMNASINMGNYSGNSNNMGGNGYHNSITHNGNQGSGFGLVQGGRFSSNPNSNSSLGDSMQIPVAYLTPTLMKEHNDMRDKLQAENEDLRKQLKQCQDERKQFAEDKEQAENDLKAYKIKSEENVVRLRNKIAQLKEVIADVQYAQEKRGLTRYVFLKPSKAGGRLIINTEIHMCILT